MYPHSENLSSQKLRNCATLKSHCQVFVICVICSYTLRHLVINNVCMSSWFVQHIVTVVYSQIEYLQLPTYATATNRTVKTCNSIISLPFLWLPYAMCKMQPGCELDQWCDPFLLCLHHVASHMCFAFIFYVMPLNVNHNFYNNLQCWSCIALLSLMSWMLDDRTALGVIHHFCHVHSKLCCLQISIFVVDNLSDVWIMLWTTHPHCCGIHTSWPMVPPMSTGLIGVMRNYSSLPDFDTNVNHLVYGFCKTPELFFPKCYVICLNMDHTHVHYTMRCNWCLIWFTLLLTMCVVSPCWQSVMVLFRKQSGWEPKTTIAMLSMSTTTQQHNDVPPTCLLTTSPQLSNFTSAVSHLLFSWLCTLPHQLLSSSMMQQVSAVVAAVVFTAVWVLWMSVVTCHTSKFLSSSMCRYILRTRFCPWPTLECGRFALLLQLPVSSLICCIINSDVFSPMSLICSCVRCLISILEPSMLVQHQQSASIFLLINCSNLDFIPCNLWSRITSVCIADGAGTILGLMVSTIDWSFPADAAPDVVLCLPFRAGVPFGVVTCSPFPAAVSTECVPWSPFPADVWTEPNVSATEPPYWATRSDSCCSALHASSCSTCFLLGFSMCWATAGTCSNRYLATTSSWNSCNSGSAIRQDPFWCGHLCQLLPHCPCMWTSSQQHTLILCFGIDMATLHAIAVHND